MKTVVVVTDAEAGWDCILGVYETLKLAVEAYGLTYEEGLFEGNYDVPGRCLVFHTRNVVSVA